ncbi:MAG: 16S rRNA (guanine(966)-N(2))-methyltransferase RsmD [Pseudomonadota bacterium]
MRIVAGKYKSRRLETPINKAIRPTSDKVRGAIFNSLKSYDVVEGAQALDIFCGTGALGLEALSHGASHCIFIDGDKRSLDLAKQNSNQLGSSHESSFYFDKCPNLKERPEDYQKSSLVFLDPPYHKNLIEPTIQALFEKSWIDDNAFFILEMAKDETVYLDELELLAEKIYGDTKIIFAQS